MQGFVAGIGPFHDPVKWYGINYAGTQITQWDFQNKGSFSSPAQSKGKAATVTHFDNFLMALQLDERALYPKSQRTKKGIPLKHQYFMRLEELSYRCFKLNCKHHFNLTDTILKNHSFLSVAVFYNEAVSILLFGSVTIEAQSFR